MTVDDFLRGQPVEYNGLGKHVTTRFIATWSWKHGIPVNVLKVVPAPGHTGPSTRQMCGENRARAFFASLDRTAE